MVESRVMETDPILTEVLLELVEKHACHTVILYGSRARGDATPDSDYDLIAIRETGPAFRDARELAGAIARP